MLCCKCGEKNRRKEEFCFSCGTVLRYPCSNGGGDSSTGMAENTAALLTYVLGWVTGLFFYFMENKSKFVKFHAMQSILVFAPLSILHIVISIIRSAIYDPMFHWGSYFGGVSGGSFAIWRILGWVSTLVWIGMLALAVILILKANQGETYKAPIVGNIAAKQLD